MIRTRMRGFAALTYVLVMSAMLLMLTIAAYSADYRIRQDLLRQQYEQQARLSAVTCVTFVLRALAQDHERTFEQGLVVHDSSSSSCIVDSVMASGTTAQIRAHATVDGYTARISATAHQSGSHSYDIDSLRDGVP
jgi:hypothetical protein